VATGHSLVVLRYFEDLFGMAGQRDAAAGASAGADLRYNMESRWRKPSPQDRQIEIPVSVTASPVRAPRQGGTKRRPARCAAAPAACGRRRDFSTLERTARLSGSADDRRPCPHARVPACDAGTDLVGQYPAGVEDGRAFGLRAKARPAFAAGAGRSLHFSVLATHLFFQRDGADLHCVFDFDGDGGAGRRIRGATIDKGKTR